MLYINAFLVDYMYQVNTAVLINIADFQYLLYKYAVIAAGLQFSIQILGLYIKCTANSCRKAAIFLAAQRFIHEKHSLR